MKGTILSDKLLLKLIRIRNFRYYTYCQLSRDVHSYIEFSLLVYQLRTSLSNLKFNIDYKSIFLVCDALPKNVENGKFQIATRSGVVGDPAVLICNSRFCLYPETVGFVTIICQPDGKWSAPGVARCCT